VKCFSKKEKLVEFTLKKKKFKSSPISLLKNGEIFPEKNLCSASFICVSGMSGNLLEVGILQNAYIENEVYIVYHLLKPNFALL